MTEPLTEHATASDGPRAPAVRSGRLDRPGRGPRQPGWQSRDILRAAALVAGVYLLIRLLWAAHTLVLTVFLGVLLGLAVSSGVDRLQRWRVPRLLGATLIVGGTVALLVGIGVWMAPTLRQQMQDLRTKLPQAVEQVERWVAEQRGGVLGSVLGIAGQGMQQGAAPSTLGGGAGAPRDTGAMAGTTAPSSARPGAAGAAPVPNAAPAAAESVAGTPASALAQVAVSAAAAQRARDSATAAAGASIAAPQAQAGGGGAPPSDATPLARATERLGGLARYLFPVFASTFAAIGALLLVIFIALYTGAEPEIYHRGLMHLFPHGARERAGEVLHRMASVLRHWLLAQLIAMVIIGAVVTITLLLLGVKAALALGIVAGLLEFIPTIGPLLAAAPAVGMGLVDSPQKALWVLVVYTGVHVLEGYVLVPFLMREEVELPPVLTIVVQVLMTLLFGFLGLFVAVPLLAAALVPVKMLYVEGVVGDRLGDEHDHGAPDDRTSPENRARAAAGGQ